MGFFKKKVFTPFAVVLLCLLFAGAAFLATYFGMRPGRRAQGDLCAAAVADSVTAEEEEIFPLVTLTQGADMVTWNEDGKRVLLLSWNDSPEVYAEGAKIVADGEIWTFTDGEILSWYRAHGEGVEGWEMRLKQLIGLPPSSDYTHMTAFWVDVADVIRPAYQPDVTKQIDASDLGGGALGEYEAWFDGNIVYSYFTSAYPWTRLGYTYDWAEGSGEYGLTEFLVLGGAEAEVEFTMTTEEFIRYLEERV